MAGLVLDFSICADCSNKTLEFQELTGTYSVNNTGGWGSPPNEALTNAYAATLDIYQPGSSTITNTIDLFQLTGPSTQYPTDDDVTGYIITDTALGISGITDGIWQFTYTILTGNTDDSITYTTTKNIFLYCNVQCCYQKLVEKISCCSCGPCEEKNIQNAIKAWGLLEGIKAMAIMGNTTSFTKCLTSLQNYCSSVNCGCNK